MIWEPFVLALVLGLIVSAGLYFAYLWPSVEPLDDEPESEAGSDTPAPASQEPPSDTAPDEPAPATASKAEPVVADEADKDVTEASPP